MIFKCKNCGGNTVYEPGRGSMYCPHCESADSEETIQGGTLQQCVNCGAPLEMQEYTSAGRCEHCGSYIVFNERVEGVYEPHMLLPFRINKKAAAQALDREFSRRLRTFCRQKVWKVWKASMYLSGCMIIRHVMILPGKESKSGDGHPGIRSIPRLPIMRWYERWTWISIRFLWTLPMRWRMV